MWNLLQKAFINCLGMRIWKYLIQSQKINDSGGTEHSRIKISSCKLHESCGQYLDCAFFNILSMFYELSNRISPMIKEKQRNASEKEKRKEEELKRKMERNYQKPKKKPKFDL